MTLGRHAANCTDHLDIMRVNTVVLLLQDGLKMGKSLGNVLDPVALVEAYGADAVRFFFLKEVDFGQVGQSWLPSCQHSLSASPHVSLLPGSPTRA